MTAPLAPAIGPGPSPQTWRLAWLGSWLGLAWRLAWTSAPPEPGFPRPTPTRRSSEPIVPWVMPHTTATAPSTPRHGPHPQPKGPGCTAKVPDSRPPAFCRQPSTAGPRPPAPPPDHSRCRAGPHLYARRKATHPWPNGSGCPAERGATDATRLSSPPAGRRHSRQDEAEHHTVPC
jgi:hypothetical protein